MLQASRARAALDGSDRADVKHLRKVAKAAIIHRRPGTDAGALRDWGQAEDERLDRVLAAVPAD